MRRKKATVSDLSLNGIRFFAYSRVKNPETGERGYRYILTNPLTVEQKAVLAQFKNVIISSAVYRYAQEIEHETIILLDKMLKG